jgi:hypothetical protein
VFGLPQCPKSSTIKTPKTWGTTGQSHHQNLDFSGATAKYSCPRRQARLAALAANLREIGFACLWWSKTIEWFVL